MREYRAGVRQTWSELLPLTGRGVALNQCTRRPVASPRTGKQWLIHVQLPPAGHDVARTLGHHGTRLIVVGLVQETTTRVHIAPQVHATARSDLALAGNERLGRSEEHTSELQSLMRISYAVFCLKKKKQNDQLHIK